MSLPWQRSEVRLVAALIHALPEAEPVRNCSHTTEISKTALALEHYFDCNQFYDTLERVRGVANPGCMAQLNSTWTAGEKLTLIKPPELHLDPNQKRLRLNLFTGIQAADYSFAHKEWMTLRRRSSQNKSTSRDQWLNRIGIISSTLHWTKEPFGLKRKRREPCTHVLSQRKPTGWKPKPANSSALIGRPNVISMRFEKGDN